MDNPSWSDTLRATLSSCFSCGNASGSDPEDNSTYGAQYAIRRARADELEGLLADPSEDDSARADTISLHSHLGPRGRRRPPPRTPRHISLWGFSLFGSGRKGIALPDADEALHRPTSTNPGAGRERRRTSENDFLADAGPAPHELADAEIERRARRRARKEMRRLARAAAESQASPAPQLDGEEFEGFPGSGAPKQLTQLFSPPSTSPPPGYIHAEDVLRAQDDEDAADLDGGSYARLAPRGPPGGGSRSSGRSSSSGGGSGSASAFSGGAPAAYMGAIPPPKPKRKPKRSTKSGSSATSSTLASPYAEEFGALKPFDGTPGGLVLPPHDEEFDGTPGGFDDAPAHLEDFAREAMPSAGLSSSGPRASGFGDRKGRAGGGAFLAGM
ncbi:hypothetical protein DFH07DRAFT_984893 [Mycena maculata]|uniref:Uncharacterized protein n=1 Tax=Mycena maculata TaxID=230809 RepID=A0AAD7K0I9_9AGAR|nr:hypothetical protein DFH07DRAFT_984893 [Mycena maculata]